MMKKISLSAAIFMATAAGSQAQEIQKLLAPNKTGGMPLMEVLNKRETTREFSGKPLSEQQMSDLLWAAWGVNRPDGKRTAPSASNNQEIDLYIFTAEGGFYYNAQEHSLEQIVKGDYRAETCTRDFGEASAVNVFFVADLSKRNGDDESKKLMSYIDAGYISQNIYLYCTSEGLGSVVYTGSLDRDRVASLLNLSDNQFVVGGHSVGIK